MHKTMFNGFQDLLENRAIYLKNFVIIINRMSGKSIDWNDIVNSYIFAACPLCQSNHSSLQCRKFEGSYREKDKNSLAGEIVSIIYNQDIA